MRGIIECHSVFSFLGNSCILQTCYAAKLKNVHFVSPIDSGAKGQWLCSLFWLTLTKKSNGL